MTAAEEKMLAKGGGDFPLEPLLSGPTARDAHVRTAVTGCRKMHKAGASAVGGTVDGTLIVTPFIVLCMLGLLTLAWATVSGKDSRRDSCRGSRETTSASQPPPSASDSGRPEGPQESPPFVAEHQSVAADCQSSLRQNEARGLSPVSSSSPAAVLITGRATSNGESVGDDTGSIHLLGGKSLPAGTQVKAKKEAREEANTRDGEFEAGFSGSAAERGRNGRDMDGERLYKGDKGRANPRGGSGDIDTTDVGGVNGPLTRSDEGESDAGGVKGASQGEEERDTDRSMRLLNEASDQNHGVANDDGIRRIKLRNHGNNVESFNSVQVKEDLTSSVEVERNASENVATRIFEPREAKEEEGEEEEKEKEEEHKLQEVGSNSVGSTKVDSSPEQKENRGFSRGSQADEDAYRASAIMEAEERDEERFLVSVRGLLRTLEQDLDAARVLLPECHRFRKVIGCVGEAVGPGMGATSRQALDLREALEEASEFTRTLSSPESFVLVMAELLSDGFEDPSAMLGSSTRRINRAVSALPEPPRSSAVASGARAQLRSLATAGTNAVILSAAAAAAAGARSRSSSFSASAAAAAAAGNGGFSDVIVPPPPLTASSSATALTTPVSGVGLSVRDGGGGDGDMGSGDRRCGGGDIFLNTPRLAQEERAEGGSTGVSNERNDGNDAIPGGNSAVTGNNNNNDDFNADPTHDLGGIETNGEEVSTTCGGGGGGGTSSGGVSGGGGSGTDTPVRSMGPSLTSEAAGLSDLIRRRGGISALTDGRAVAAVLRAAAPRRSHTFHQRRPRSFFDAEADESAGTGLLTLSTPVRGRSGAVGGSGGEEVGTAETNESGGSGSIYVSTACGGFFGGTKSPQVLSPSAHEALPWPSPQDANGVCQKLAKRVESRVSGGTSRDVDLDAENACVKVEAMVPFTCTNPAPACERRRLRLVNNFFFSVLARGDPFGARSRRDSGEGNSNRDILSEFGDRRKDCPRRVGGQGVDARPVADFECRLYAVLGALLEAAKELVPGAREGGAAVNAVGDTTVLTLKGACALDRAPCTRDTSLTTYPRKTSMCQHALCTPRLGRKTLEGGARQEDGVLLVPDCRKLKQEIVRSTCMDPMGRIRPDYVSYVAAPILADGAPLGTFCVFSRKSLKELGWTAPHTAILRGLADAASTEMVRICRLAELDCQRGQHERRRHQSISSTGDSPNQQQQSSTAHPPLLPLPSRGLSLRTAGVGGNPSSVASPPVSPARSRSAQYTWSSESGYSRGGGGGGANGDGASLTVLSTAANGNLQGGRDGDDGDRALISGTVDRGAEHAAAGRHAQVNEQLDASTADQSSGNVFLNRLDNVASPSTRSRRRSRQQGTASSDVLPLLGRASGANDAATTAMSAAAAAARGGAASGAMATAGGAPESNGSKLWTRALRKLKFKKRKNSTGGGSDEGNNGSSSSLDGSRRRARGSTESQQVFVERSRAW